MNEVDEKLALLLLTHQIWAMWFIVHHGKFGSSWPPTSHKLKQTDHPLLRILFPNSGRKQMVPNGMMAIGGVSKHNIKENIQKEILLRVRGLI